MTALVINSFGPMAPKVSPRLLSDTQSQMALNCDLRHGYLAGMKGMTDLDDPLTFTKEPSVQTIYRYGMTQATDQQYWFNWTGDVDVAQGLLVNDTDEFTYFTGDGYPKLTYFNAATTGGTDYPITSYQLGIPVPDLTPSLTATGIGTGATETRAYCFTYVAKYLSGARVFEGAPGPTSIIDILPGQGVDIGNMGTAAPNTSTYPTTGNYSITHKRIYRTVSGMAGATDFFLVVEIPIWNETYSDTLPNTEVSQSLPLTSTLYDVPVENLQGLISISNGMLAGFNNRDWYVCEPNQPHAWPGDYRKTLDHPIVMHQHMGGNATVVTTNSFPYIIYGTSPGAMTSEKLPFPQANVNKMSMVAVPGGVMYASPDGLCFIGAGTYQVITKDIITREQWKNYKPETMFSCWFEGMYIGFHDYIYTAGHASFLRQGAIIFKPDTGEFREYKNQESISSAYCDPKFGEMYVTVESVLKRWEYGNPLSATWKSKEYQLPKPVSMVACKVLAASYPVMLDIYRDGVWWTTRTVANAKPFKLPGGFKSRIWSLAVTASQIVYQVVMGESIAEITQV